MQNLHSIMRRAAHLACCAFALVCFPSGAGAQPVYKTVPGAGGVPLSVTIDGPADAPALLFIHGLGQSSLSWSAQFGSSLAQRYRLVAFDLRGHGASGKPWAEGAYADTAMAADVAAVMAATGIVKPVVIAWSYGTYVINDYIRVHSAANVAGVIYIGATGGFAAPAPGAIAPDIAEQLKTIRALQTAPDLASQIEGARLSSAFLYQRDVGEAIKQRSLNIGLMLPLYARSALYTRRYDSQGAETMLADVPLLFLDGSKDAALSGDVPARLLKLLPQSEIRIYDGSGHSPFMEEPDRFNADVERFVQKIATGERAKKPAKRR